MTLKLLNKILISLLCIMLIFNASVKPKKTKAVAPALLWVAGAIVGDVVAELGWKYAAKPALDTIISKVSKKVVDNKDSFDFTKKKPKKNGKKIDIDISPLDRAKIASELRKESDVIIKKYNAKLDKPMEYIGEADFDDVDPLYSTGVKLNFEPFDNKGENLRYYDFFRRLFDVTLEPRPYYKQTRFIMSSTLNDEGYRIDIDGGRPYESYKVRVYYHSYGSIGFRFEDSKGVVRHQRFTEWSLSKTLRAFEIWEQRLIDSKKQIYLAEGLFIPEESTKIYNIPLETPSTYKPPNADKLDVDISIPLSVDVDDTEIELEWESLDIYQTDINKYINRTLNQMDFTKNVNIVVNNYYTTIEGDKTQEEVDNDIGVILPPTDPGDKTPTVPDDGGGSGPPAEIPSNFFDLMAQMGGKVVDMYNGLVGFMDISVAKMTDLTKGTAGLVVFLTAFFSWLPREYVTLISVALMLGVVGFFLRR